MTRKTESVLIAGDAIAGLFGDEGDALSETLADGARLVTLSPPAVSAARYSHIPWPEMTVRLSELGFIVENATRDGSDGAEVYRLEARKTSVIVRGYRAGDEHAIRELFLQSFHQPLSPELWRWRYCENPLGALRISVAISHEGRMVGHYGGYPMVFEHDQSKPFDFAQGKQGLLLAHQNGDVMTDRSARRLGHGGASLVRRMAQHFWAAYGEGRVDFHYGFNTDTARELQKRVVPGVRVLEDVGSWVSEGTLSQFGEKARDGRNLRAERVTRFTDEWNAFVQRVRSAYGTLVRRDATYLNWRYADRPMSDDVLVLVRERDQIVGGAVFRIKPDETHWGDALFDPRQPAAPALALDLLRSLSAHPRMRAWFPARPDWWVRILSDLGFRQEREPHGLSVVYVPFTPAAERLVPDLYYSWGDSDLF